MKHNKLTCKCHEGERDTTEYLLRTYKVKCQNCKVRIADINYKGHKYCNSCIRYGSVMNRI